MKVVVIGGTGNISRSIVRLLLAHGHDVTCFNRGKTQPREEGTHQLVGDRKDPESFVKIMQGEKFDAVIDMRCYNAEEAEAAVKAFDGRISHYVFCSTTCVYGVDYDWMPVTEDHPRRAFTAYGKGKAAAEDVFMRAYHNTGFPVTILRPSTTYGNKLGLLRQIGGGFSWLDRIRKGKPILVSGDGNAIHQFLHVDDAAYGFVGAMEHDHCIGQVYNLVGDGYVQFDEYHRTAMEVIGREVPMVGLPLDTLMALDSKRFCLAGDEFSYNDYYSCEKVYRDIPEFRQRISLKEGMTSVLKAMDEAGRIPDSDTMPWEDDLIEMALAIKNYKMPE